MNSNGDDKPEPADPEGVARMLELELMRQRATRAKAPYRRLRAASLIFLFVVILGTLLAFCYVFYAGGLDQFRTQNTPQSSPTAAPTQPKLR
jgi:hypothetical protein